MKILILPIAVLLFTACSSAPKEYSQAEDTISIMAYNVENLFDAEHDEGTEDFTYLPRDKKTQDQVRIFCQGMSSQRYKEECFTLDWNEDVIKRKLQRLADVILQVNNGKGPDVIIVEEVENIKILQRLSREFLPAANYQSVVLLEGPDKRGIDVGMMSRFPLVGKPELHVIPYAAEKSRNQAKDQEWMDRSRGILQSDFKLPDGTILTVFGVHLPSQANPTYWRRQALAHLDKLQKKIPANHLVISGGDFNISAEEDRHHGLVSDLTKEWLVSHRIGCESCPGTHMYRGGWSFLDMLLFRKNMAQGSGSTAWYVDAESIAVPNVSRYQISRFGSPARFNETGGIGVSDHWPIYARLKKRGASTVIAK